MAFITADKKKLLNSIRFLILLLLVSCGLVKNTNPCNMDADVVEGKLIDHPDLEAYRAEIYVFEKDGSPAKGRKVWLSLGEKWIRRNGVNGIYSSTQYTYAGIQPRTTLGDEGYLELHLVESKMFSIQIVPFNDIRIKTHKGKSQKFYIYLEDITYSDCTDYIDAYQKANGIQRP